MHILDGVFIRHSQRRKGWGTAMLTDLVLQFPEQDLGFSHPISHSLHLGGSLFLWSLYHGLNQLYSSVLINFLNKHSEHRSRFWSVRNCGEEGDRLNLWLSRKMMHQQWYQGLFLSYFTLCLFLNKLFSILILVNSYLSMNNKRKAKQIKIGLVVIAARKENSNSKKDTKKEF